jgi:glycosyltransferase involved in cell wall biosynthesis
MAVARSQRNQYLRERFSIPTNKKIFVYLGGVQRDRGLGQVVNAMHALRNEAVFVIVGDGELRKGLESVARNAGLVDCVHFHDPVPSDDVLSVLASADVGVALVDTDAPSYALALPSKIYEYLMAGLPVLASPMKQVLAEFATHPALKFVKLQNESAIVSAAKELLKLAEDRACMDKVQGDAINAYSFEHDAQPFARFLEERIQ